MAYFNSWDEAKAAFGLDLTSLESFANQPYEILNLLVDIVNERLASCRYIGTVPSSTPYLEINSAVSVGDITNFIGDFVYLMLNVFVKNVDSNGNLITDMNFWNNKPMSEMETWDEAGLQAYLNMERPILSPVYTDAVVSDKWLYWHFNALALMILSTTQDSYDTPFSGWLKTGSGLTWKDAVGSFNEAAWTQIFFFNPGAQNSFYVGITSYKQDALFVIERVKMLNVGLRLPQEYGTPLYQKNCDFYHYLNSFGYYGRHSNKDYRLDNENNLYLEKAYNIEPSYVLTDVENFDLSPVGGFDNANVGKPVDEYQTGYQSFITHRNLSESKWGIAHKSFYNFAVTDGFTYQMLP